MFELKLPIIRGLTGPASGSSKFRHKTKLNESIIAKPKRKLAFARESLLIQPIFQKNCVANLKFFFLAK